MSKVAILRARRPVAVRVGWKLLTVVIVQSAACADQKAPATTRPGASDTTHISASYLANAPSGALTESLRLGASTGANAYAFDRIEGVVASEAGDIFVLDASNASVVVFDRDGRLVRKFGRAGQGPGEFRGKTNMALALAQDTVFVLEYSGVLHAFSADGSVLFSATVDSLSAEEPRMRIDRLEHTPFGLVVARPRSSRFPATESVPSVDSTRVQLRSASPGYFAKPGVPLPGLEAFRFGKMFTSRMFGATPAFALSRSGRIYYSRGDQYVVDVLSLDGHLDFQIVGQISPMRVTSEDNRIATALFDSALKTMRSANAGGAMPVAGDVRRIPRAEYRSVLGRLIAGDADTILVERTDLGPIMAKPANPSSWDVISTSRGLLKRFTMPGGFSPMYYRNGALYGVESDTLGVQVVVRYHLR